MPLEADEQLVDWNELRHFQGDIDLGFNATGMVRSTMHFQDGELIIQESMPAKYVAEIMDNVARFAADAKKRPDGGYLRGQIPITIYWGWRREWEKGPRGHGVLWRAFLSSKILDRDWSKFLIKR